MPSPTLPLLEPPAWGLCAGSYASRQSRLRCHLGSPAPSTGEEGVVVAGSTTLCTPGTTCSHDSPTLQDFLPCTRCLPPWVVCC